MSGGETLSSLANLSNLGEPIPLSNKPAVILGVLIPLQVLATICALLRLWTRLRVIQAPGYDDLFVSLSTITTLIGTTVICYGSTSAGLGKHFYLLGSEEAMRSYLHGFYVSNGTYVLSTTFIKTALLLQYLRIFDRGSFLYRFSIGIGILVGLWGLAYSVLAWIPCYPVPEFWSGNPEANCWGFASQKVIMFRTTFETHAAMNMVFDVIVLSIPVMLYFQMDVHSKMRLGVLGVLLLGTAANIMSVWRFVSVVQHKAATWPSFDPTWYGCVSIILGAIEVDIAVICASVPVFWPVLHSTGFQIFITKEVQVTSESRLRSVDEASKGIELHYTGTMADGGISVDPKTGIHTMERQPSLRSQAGSEDNLHNPTSRQSSDAGPLGSQDDMYGLTSKDPSGRTRWKQPGTQVSISAHGGLKKP